MITKYHWSRLLFEVFWHERKKWAYDPHTYTVTYIWSDFVVFLSKLDKIFILGFLNPKRLTYVSFCLFRESFSVTNGKT